MRVGVDIRELVLDKRTGIGRYLISFLSEATGLSSDIEFMLYGNQNTRRVDLPRTKTRVLPEYFTFLWDQYRLPRALAEDKIDLFFSPYYKAPFNAPCPMVITIHDLLFLRFPRSAGERFLKNPLFKFYARRIINSAKVVITDSICSKNDILHYLSSPEDKVKVVYPGIDPRFKPRSEEEQGAVLRSYGIERGYFLYLGNFKPHKNLATLLLGYARLPLPIKRKYYLLLVGGDEESALPLIKTGERLSLRVKFLHSLPDDDLPYFYSGASLFVFPSFAEGFGYPPLEAMACGTPVVVSSSSSIPEVVGDAGVYFSPNDPDELAGKMELLMGNPQLRKRLSFKGLRRAELFTTREMAEKILNLFKTVAKETDEG